MNISCQGTISASDKYGIDRKTPTSCMYACVYVYDCTCMCIKGEKMEGKDIRTMHGMKNMEREE